MTLLVTPVVSAEDFEIAKAIRLQVFVHEQGFDAAADVDQYDHAPTTRQFLGKDVEQDTYVATARVLITPEDRVGKIGRVAVLKQCRGKRYGVALMDAVERALAHECDTYLVSSIYDRRVFYEKCGYAYANDEVYLEKGIDHCLMVKKAPTTE